MGFYLKSERYFLGWFVKVLLDWNEPSSAEHNNGFSFANCEVEFLAIANNPTFKFYEESWPKACLLLSCSESGTTGGEGRNSV